MNTKALITLEYDKIIKKLETFASSTMGKALCKDLLPSSDYEEILSAQTETKDALTRLYKTGYLSFQGLSDIRPHLRLLEIDSTFKYKGASRYCPSSFYYSTGCRIRRYGR
mgnify:CR=1 FL=1